MIIAIVMLSLLIHYNLIFILHLYYSACNITYIERQSGTSQPLRDGQHKQAKYSKFSQTIVVQFFSLYNDELDPVQLMALIIQKRQREYIQPTFDSKDSY